MVWFQKLCSLGKVNFLLTFTKFIDSLFYLTGLIEMPVKLPTWGNILIVENTSELRLKFAIVWLLIKFKRVNMLKKGFQALNLASANSLWCLFQLNFSDLHQFVLHSVKLFGPFHFPKHEVDKNISQTYKVIPPRQSELLKCIWALE